MENNTADKINNLFTSTKPMKLEPCRVYRTYLGGKLIDEWRGIKGEDTHFPEEWLGSTVKARNPGREQFTEEGYSYVSTQVDGKGYRVRLKDLIDLNPVGILGQRHFNKYGKETAVLSKLVDSAMRLTIQVHPTKESAQKYFNYPFGKTEAWYILETRSINGSEPYILLGFKEGITKEKWFSVYKSQDIEAMINLMHRVPVKPGDMVLVRSGMPHGMGEGVLFVEIQEPCDITIRTEKTTPTGIPLTDEICSCGAGVEAMMDMFDYTGMSMKDLIDSCFIKPSVIIDGKGYLVSELIGSKTTDCFSIYRLKCAESSCSISINGFCILIAYKGSGLMHFPAGSIDLKQGEAYFIPAGVNKITWQSNKEMDLILCCPPGTEVS